MKNSNLELLHFDSDNSNACSRHPHPTCFNAIDIATILNLNNSYHKKTKLISHIYRCQGCHNEFNKYLSLLDKTEAFCILSGDILQRPAPPQERKLLSLGLQPHSLVYSILTIFVAAIIVFFTFSPIDNNNKTIPSQTRGLSSPFADVFPKPFSLVSRELLYFRWEFKEQSLPQGVCLYNSALELIWESEYSLIKMAVLPDQLKSRLIINHQYYWAIKSKSESGTVFFSILLPFSIKD